MQHGHVKNSAYHISTPSVLYHVTVGEEPSLFLLYQGYGDNNM